MLRTLVSQRDQCKHLAQQWRLICRRALATTTRQQHEPLRILFCGSEGFSIASLKALRDFQRSPDSNILSIDVATRKDKPAGRGLKELRAPEIKKAAAQLGLRVHQFDTFTGWYLPEFKNSTIPYINLVIAVSFGLLVPPRILNNTKYGGLNVHPSMLPHLRGPAPLNWSIIRGDTHTGVTVQSLHPSKFDHGVILAQTPQPGIAVPNPNSTTASELRHLLAPIGAEMLVQTIRNKLYLQPYAEILPTSSYTSHESLSMAPKIVPSMKVLNPYNDGAATILRKNRGMPKLWADVKISTHTEERAKRIIFGTGMRNAGPEDLPQEVGRIVDDISVGVPFAVIPLGEDIHQSQEPIHLKVCDNGVLTIPRILVAGNREGPAAAAAAHAKLFANVVSKGSYSIHKFQCGLEPHQNSS